MKKILVIYLLILIVGVILPINGKDSYMNNNYIFDIRFDYLLHGMICFPLYPLLSLAYSPKIFLNKVFFLTFALIIAFAIEWLQYFISYRTFNVNDLISNGVGAMFGFVLFEFLYSRLNIQTNKGIQKTS